MTASYYYYYFDYFDYYLELVEASKDNGLQSRQYSQPPPLPPPLPPLIPPSYSSIGPVHSNSIARHRT